MTDEKTTPAKERKEIPLPPEMPPNVVTIRGQIPPPYIPVPFGDRKKKRPAN